MEKSLVEKITVSEIFPIMASKDWAHITGNPVDFSARAFYYRLGAVDYQEICGAIVPPAKGPGFAVMIGLGREDDERIDPGWNLGTKRITVLDEIEAEGLNDLIEAVLEWRRKYSPALDKGVYCDSDEALDFRISQIMSRKEKENFLVMIPGLYHGQATAFRDYVYLLSQYRRILDRGKCRKLRAYMDQFPKEAVLKTGDKTWEDWPAVTALAYAVHGLIMHPILDEDGGAIEDENEVESTLFLM